jgi:hypothetical protein
MHDDDPEKRIRELERRLAEHHGSPRENYPGPYQAAPAPGTFPPPGMYPPPTPGWYAPPPGPGMMPPPPAGAGVPDYAALRHQMNRRHRLSGFWAVFIAPGIIMILFLVSYLYR